MPRSQKPPTSRAGKPDTSAFKPLDAQLTDYFASRGISQDTLERNRVAQEHTWMPGQPAGTAIAFPYLRNGKPMSNMPVTLRADASSSDRRCHTIDLFDSSPKLLYAIHTQIIHKSKCQYS